MSDTDDVEFRPGQVWAYRAREGEPASRLRVLKVDRAPDDVVVHFAADNLHMHTRRGKLTAVGHMPLTLAAARASVTELERTELPPPPIPDAYHHWRTAFEAGQAGVFVHPAAEAIGLLEGTIDPPPGG